MIYPRLKLKSEVFANILDGAQTEFNIENDQQAPVCDEMTEDEIKRLAKEDKLIEKTMVTEQNTCAQTNIKDFFFGIGTISSKSGADQEPSTAAESTALNGTTEATDTACTQTASLTQQAADFKNNNNKSQSQPESDEEFDGMPPIPPLASANINIIASD